LKRVLVGLLIQITGSAMIKQLVHKKQTTSSQVGTKEVKRSNLQHQNDVHYNPLKHISKSLHEYPETSHQ
jgi:hypothetical protein